MRSFQCKNRRECFVNEVFIGGGDGVLSDGLETEQQNLERLVNSVGIKYFQQFLDDDMSFNGFILRFLSES